MKVVIAISVDEKLVPLIDATAKADNRNRSQLIETLILNHLKEEMHEIKETDETFGT